MRFKTIFFDLDDTLYPSTSGLWQAIKARMNTYMSERIGIPQNEIPSLRESYFNQYGTTLRGLEAHHQVNVADFLAYVHALPLKDYIHPDGLQRSIFASLDTRNYIFTNADQVHAKRVLTELQLESYFEDIVDVNMMAPFCKPMPESFKLAMKLAGETDASRCMLVDDLPRTTRAARELGMFAVLYGNQAPTLDADACLSDWSELPSLLDHQ